MSLQNAKRDNNHVTTLLGVDISDLATPTLVGVDAVTNRLLVSAIITGGGSSGTQYTTGTSTPVPAVGTLTVFDSAGTITAVSVANPLPVSATISTAGLATSANQTNAAQKTQIVDGSGNVIAATTNALNVDVINFPATQPVSGTLTVIGSVASGSAVSGNPVLVGGQDGTNARTFLTDTSGNQGIFPKTTTSALGDALSNTATFSTNSAGTALNSLGLTYIFGGTSWERMRTANTASNTTGTGLAATGVLGFDGTNYQRLKVDTAGDQLVIGATASGSSLTVAPVTEGGLAKTANPTAVSDGQVVNATFDKLGKQVVVGSIRDLKVNQVTTITASASETTVLTQVASTFLDVYGVIVTNTSATAITVAFKDSTAGTTQFNVAVPAGDTRGFMLPESGAIKQGTVNNNWTATTQSVTSVVITMLAVKNI